GSFLFCAGLALLPLGSSFGFAAFTVAVWSVGEMLAFPISPSVVGAMGSGESLGRYMGVFHVTYATAFMVAPLAGTWVYQHLGPGALWYGGGGVGIVLWVGSHLLAAARQRQRGPEVAEAADA